MTALTDPRERASILWARSAGLVTREDRELATEILAAEIRVTLQEGWMGALERSKQR